MMIMIIPAVDHENQNHTTFSPLYVFHSLQKPDFLLLRKLKYMFSRVFPNEYLENAQGAKKTIKFPSTKYKVP